MEPRSVKERKRKRMIDMKKKMNNMTKEQIKAAVVKKKECNAKAMLIVERLIEPNVEEIWLLDNLFHINQSHFQDAVEERAIGKFCGYPLCDNVLEGIPLKQYHISTKYNKVFDITDRKNYCTNFCYRAGVYLKDQLYTSPLWMRDCEDVVEFKFLKSNNSGSSGKEIDLGNVRPVKHIQKYGSNTNDQTLAEIQKPERNHESVVTNSVDQTPDKCKSLGGLERLTHHPLEQSPQDTEKPSEPRENIVKESNSVEMKPVKIEDRRREKKRRSVDSNEMQLLDPIGKRIEQHFATWITLETLIFLFGEEKVKVMFWEYGTPMNANDFNPILEKDVQIKERYMEICRRLNILELKDKSEDIAVPSKPLPNYDELKQEAEKIKLKVRNFFRGDTKVAFKEKTEQDDTNVESEPKEYVPPILPLIDQYSVNTARRRIVLDKLNRVLPDIQIALNLNHINLRKELQTFVFSLALTASNITLKPSEWALVSIVLLKLFSLQNEYLDCAFNSSLTQKRVINLLMAYSLNLEYLERQIMNLYNLEQVINNTA